MYMYMYMYNCTCTFVYAQLGLRIRFECSNLCSIASHLKLNFSLWNFVATPTLMFAHVHLCNVNVWSIMAASISFLSPVILNPSRNSERNRLVILVPIMVRTILQIKTHANLRIFVCFCWQSFECCFAFHQYIYTCTVHVCTMYIHMYMYMCILSVTVRVQVCTSVVQLQ